MTTDGEANGLGCLEFHPHRTPAKVDFLLRRAINSASRRPRPGLGDHHRSAAFWHGVGQRLQTHYRQRNDPFAVILEG
jgi:hypothetical protein